MKISIKTLTKELFINVNISCVKDDIQGDSPIVSFVQLEIS